MAGAPNPIGFNIAEVEKLDRIRAWANASHLCNKQLCFFYSTIVRILYLSHLSQHPCFTSLCPPLRPLIREPPYPWIKLKTKWLEPKWLRMERWIIFVNRGLRNFPRPFLCGTPRPNIWVANGMQAAGDGHIHDDGGGGGDTRTK